MKVIRSIDDLVRDFPIPVIAVGNFDGVHKGHYSIFTLALQRATALQSKSVIVTFDPHPQVVIARNKPFSLITGLDEKLDLISNCKVDAVFVMPFDEEVSRIEPEDFVRRVYVDRLGIKEIVVGHSHAFGYQGSGNINLLIAAGQTYGFKVHVAEPYHVDTEIVNSSRIRALLIEGRIPEARILLGHDYRLRGVVGTGSGRGRLLGFATANMDFMKDPILLPKRGVYMVRVPIGNTQILGVMNIGNRPTFNGTSETCEVHLIDFDSDLYGQELVITVVERLRDEMKFPSATSLKAQINKDVERARMLLQQ